MNREPTPQDTSLEDLEEKTPNQFEEESRQAKVATQKLKKRIMVVIAGMLVFAVVGMLALGWLDSLEQGQNGEEDVTKGRPNTVIYYEPDYDYDIMKDQEYLDLDRYIYYKDKQTNETILIEDKDIEKNNYGPAVQTLKKMIDAIIAGDHEAYNALFSSNYFANEKNKPEEPFTMQQVYDILFTKVNVSYCSDEEFGKYTMYEFEVEYKIHKNNGTFRVDLGHDDSRKQYFILSDSTSNEVLIDQILGYNYK